MCTGNGNQRKYRPADTNLPRRAEPGQLLYYYIRQLEDIFLQKYPLATHRYNYMNTRQLQGMTMSTFIPTLKKKAEKADIVGLQPEQLFSTNVHTLSHVQTTSLRREITGVR